MKTPHRNSKLEIPRDPKPKASHSLPDQLTVSFGNLSGKLEEIDWHSQNKERRFDLAR